MKALRKFMLIMATFVLIVLVGCIANQIYHKDNIVEITQTGFIIFIDLVALIALYYIKKNNYEKIILSTLLFTITLISCHHNKNGEIVRDKNGNYYELTSEGVFPTEAYRLHPIDTSKYKVVNFKEK